jgi:multicomponent Na+:H+ antiporter subunit B
MDILLFGLLVLSAAMVVLEQKVIRMIIYLAVFSLISSLCFLVIASPDVAIAEAVIGIFNTVIFIVALEKYDAPARWAESVRVNKTKENLMRIAKRFASAAFCALLFILFASFIPTTDANPLTKDQFIARFALDIGGENAVSAIYLGYRVYDTLFEALMLLISIVAIIHISMHRETSIDSTSRFRHIAESDITSVTIRLISPLLIVFGVYLIFNGHISPGGGFQGGVVLAAFFVCRYIVYNISDISPTKILTLEKAAFVGIVLLASLFTLYNVTPFIPQNIYLVLMNVLIGAKVACGFIIIFYRFIVFERRPA